MVADPATNGGPPKPRYCEFFAGGGMARLGLGSGWVCAFANDCSPLKTEVYEANFGKGSILCKRIEEIQPSVIPNAELMWASFPCQDLSLAGTRGGIHKERSGAFWSFWQVVAAKNTNRPPIIVLENVLGFLSSGDGRDFPQVIGRIRADGYEVGGMVIDAARFVPQSRKRLFLIAVRTDYADNLPYVSAGPNGAWHPDVLRTAIQSLKPRDRHAWLWWTPGVPTALVPSLESLLDLGDEVTWDSEQTTAGIIGLMSDSQRTHLREAAAVQDPWVGTLVMRMRRQPNGKNVQRAEVRHDGLANCLRTPVGGASIQRIVMVSGGKTKTRKLTTTEAARLMGLPRMYKLPKSTTKAYHVLGDGLAVPVVVFLQKELLKPLVAHVVEMGWRVGTTAGRSEELKDIDNSCVNDSLGASVSFRRGNATSASILTSPMRATVGGTRGQKRS
jgi:DNA (cytosine-5)-methyltransferase 1